MSELTNQFDSVIEKRKQYLEELNSFSDHLRKQVISKYKITLLAEKIGVNEKTIRNKFSKPSSFKDDEIRAIIEVINSIDEL